MTVAFDGIVFALQRQGGISRYFRELFVRHAARDPRSKLTLYRDEGDVRDIPSANIVRRKPRFLERYRRCEVGGETVFHSSYYRLPAGNAKVVTTVHDFTYERYRQGPARVVHSLQKRQAIRQADAVICISEATRLDLLEMCPGVPEARIAVIPNGVSNLFLESRGHHAAEVPYVLYVGSRDAAYKNFASAVAATKLLPELSLIAAGPQATEAEQQLARDSRGKIKFATVTDEELRALYEGAVCTLYPSLYEGFGLPLLEAMACRCPVVCLPSPGVKETAGTGAYLVDQDSAQAFAATIKEMLHRPRESARLEEAAARAREYTWDRSYERTAAVYRSLGWS